MGKIFDDLSYASGRLYMGAPVEEIKALNEQKSKDYVISRQERDKLDIALNNLDLRDVDYDIKKSAIESAKNNLNSYAQNGDWQNAKYAVSDEFKKMQTNTALKGAIQAKQSRDEDIKAKNQLVKEGKLSEDAANWAFNNAKNEKIGINPDGTISGGYSGANVINDKEITKEIYEKADKRIKDWREDKVILVNGKEIQKQGNGQYFVKGTQEIVRPEEVRNALVNEIKSSYGDFLRQEKAIDFDKITQRGTKPLELADFQTLGYRDKQDLLKDAGVSDIDLEQLKNSKDPQVQKYYEIAKNNRETLEKQLENPEGLKQIFSNLYDKKQINKYVQGATDKASYIKQDADWMLDHDRQKNIDFAHAKALKDYDEKLKQRDVPPTVFGDAPLEKLTSKNLENINLTNEELENNIKQTENNLKNAKTDKQKNDLTLQLQNLKNVQQTGYSNKVDILKKLDDKNPEVLNKYITYGLYNKNTKDGIINEILNNPSKYDSQLGGFARTLLNKIKNNEKQKDTFANMQKITDVDITTLKTLINKQQNKDVLIKSAISNIDKVDDNYNINVLGSNSFINRQTLKNNLKDLETTTIEKNNIMLDYANKNFAITKELEPENNALKDLIVNGMTTLTRNDLNLDQFILSKGLIDMEGKPLKSLDWNNIDVRPQVNWTTGEPSIQVSIKNAKDKSSKEGQENFPTYTFNPSDPETVKTVLKQMGKKLSKSLNPEAKQQGNMLQANAEYGQEVAVFNPKVGGLSPQTTVYIQGNPVTLRGNLIKSKGAADVYEISVVNPDGSLSEPKWFEQSNGKEYNHFSSAQDVADALFTTYNQQ